MKIEIKKWRLRNFFRFLFLTLDKTYSEEFSTNFFGYLFFQGIKKIFVDKDYKFAIYVGGEFAGSVALYHKKEGYELGYFILRKFRNKGVASEASSEMLDYGFKRLRLKRIIAIIDMKNEASNKIVKKLGFRLKKRDNKNKELFWEKNR
jgi:RimJ/RimL family protein N-acetyltransferase